jgi:ArsR family transcriptional regulator
MSTLTQRRVREVSELLTTIAEPHRLLILRHLRRGARSAGYLAHALRISPSLASHHLAALVDAGLITRRRRGPFVCYAADRDRVGMLHRQLGELAGALMPEEAWVATDPC